GPPMMAGYPGGMAPPMSGPPMSGPPMSGPPMSGPPMSGPPMSAPPMRPMSAPPMSGPPMRPMSAPPMSGPPYVGGFNGGPPRYDKTEFTTGGCGGDGGCGRRGRMDLTHEMRFDLNGSIPTSGGPASPSEVQRIDSMRRTFTARRFGSGYDALQVNRLFDAIIAALSGRSGMPLNENELD